MQRHAPDRATFGLPATMPERYGCPDAGYIAATITRTMRSLTTMRTTIILTTGAAKPCVSPDGPQHPETASHLLQRLIKVRQQIIHIFNPNGDTHQAIGNAESRTLFGTDGSMRHRGRMRDQRLNPTQWLTQRADANPLEQRICLFQRSRLERDH